MSKISRLLSVSYRVVSIFRLAAEHFTKIFSKDFLKEVGYIGLVIGIADNLNDFNSFLSGLEKQKKDTKFFFSLLGLLTATIFTLTIIVSNLLTISSTFLLYSQLSMMSILFVLSLTSRLRKAMDVYQGKVEEPHRIRIIVKVIFRTTMLAIVTGVSMASLLIPSVNAIASNICLATGISFLAYKGLMYAWKDRINMEIELAKRKKEGNAEIEMVQLRDYSQGLNAVSAPRHSAREEKKEVESTFGIGAEIDTLTDKKSPKK